MSASPAVSATVEDYAKAIYRLQEGTVAAVTTGDLARRLDVTPGSASAMMRKLAVGGLAEYAPYRGITLTIEGRRLALEVIRRHRLIEMFLHAYLDVPLDEVHAEAEELEHYVSAALAERIADRLGHPTLDPHGTEIPPLDHR